MIIDELTKVLISRKHKAVVKMTGIKDQLEFFAFIQKEKDLREFFQRKTRPEISELFR